MERNGKGSGFHLEYGTERITFELSFSKRKRLMIYVHPDQRVRVLAPLDARLETVMARLQRRAGWISRQLRYFEEFAPPPRPKRFVEGETHRYLGRQYRLKFERSESRRVKLRGRFLHIESPIKPNPSVVESLLDMWYRERATSLLHRKVEESLRSSYLQGVGRPNIRIRNMKRRWGSCSERSGIIFNLSLIKTPLDCIEYVVVHELCHLRVLNHSRTYYELLAKCMPDWEKRKARLPPPFHQIRSSPAPPSRYISIAAL